MGEALRARVVCRGLSQLALMPLADLTGFKVMQIAKAAFAQVDSPHIQEEHVRKL